MGVTRYGLLDAQVFKSINSVAGFNWGIFKWNIGSETTNTYPNYMMMLRAMYQYGLRVVCPYAWFSGYPYQILQIANNTAFIQAIRDFAQQVGNVPRGTSSQGFISPADILEDEYTDAQSTISANLSLALIPCVISLCALLPILLVKRKISKKALQKEQDVEIN